MAMRRTNIYLEDEKLGVLKHLANVRGATVSDLVRQAVDVLLAEQLQQERNWGQRLDDLVDRVRSRVPVAATSDEIEADVTEARSEVNARRRAGGR